MARLMADPAWKYKFDVARQTVRPRRKGPQIDIFVHLRELMAASQSGELRLLGHFWLSWFGSSMQICSPQERATMPGLLDDAELDRLREVPQANSIRSS